MPEVKMTKYMNMSSIWVLSGCQADGYRPIHQLEGIILIQNYFSKADVPKLMFQALALRHFLSLTNNASFTTQ